MRANGGMSRVDLAQLVFNASEAGLVSISTSTVTLVEVRQGANSSTTSQQSRVGVIDDLFDRSLTRFVEVGRDVALSARQIANWYGISTMDAIQVASAEAAGCDELFIWDNRIVNKFSADPMPGLSIREPHWEE